MTAALEAVESGSAAVLMVAKSDRLARSLSMLGCVEDLDPTDALYPTGAIGHPYEGRHPEVIFLRPGAAGAQP